MLEVLDFVYYDHWKHLKEDFLPMYIKDNQGYQVLLNHLGFNYILKLAAVKKRTISWITS